MTVGQLNHVQMITTRGFLDRRALRVVLSVGSKEMLVFRWILHKTRKNDQWSRLLHLCSTSILVFLRFRVHVGLVLEADWFGIEMNWKIRWIKDGFWVRVLLVEDCCFSVITKWQLVDIYRWSNVCLFLIYW